MLLSFHGHASTRTVSNGREVICARTRRLGYGTLVVRKCPTEKACANCSGSLHLSDAETVAI